MTSLTIFAFCLLGRVWNHFASLTLPDDQRSSLDRADEFARVKSNEFITAHFLLTLPRYKHHIVHHLAKMLLLYYPQDPSELLVNC